MVGLNVIGGPSVERAGSYRLYPANSGGTAMSCLRRALLTLGLLLVPSVAVAFVVEGAGVAGAVYGESEPYASRHETAELAT